MSENTLLLATLLLPLLDSLFRQAHLYKYNYVMGSIFSRTTSDQLKAIKAFLRAAQKATLISSNSGKNKIVQACNVTSLLEAIDMCWSTLSCISGGGGGYLCQFCS